jgi:hypothetical protein
MEKEKFRIFCLNNWGKISSIRNSMIYFVEFQIDLSFPSGINDIRRGNIGWWFKLNFSISQCNFLVQVGIPSAIW